MISDLETYPSWMPFCTTGETVGDRQISGRDVAYDGSVGFGFETGSFLGTLGDNVSYRVTCIAPGPADGSDDPETEFPAYANVNADALDGFAYGKKLVYDWNFRQYKPGHTKVSLDLLFQAKGVLYLPFWDSMQNMVIGKMLDAFK